jgi:hypothetical protein
MLKKKQQGESEDIYINDKKIWSITKQYDATKFDDDESCLGYKIDVYQDTINQSISEYLVNFAFLTNTMQTYGFSLLTPEESKYLKLPKSSGMFSELYQKMEMEVNKYPEKQVEYKDALYMEDYEKKISFLNRYFVYKKISTRNAEKLTQSLLNQLPGEVNIEEAGKLIAKSAIQEVEKQYETEIEIKKPEGYKKSEEYKKPKVKKLVGKLKLVEATEALEEEAKKVDELKKVEELKKEKKKTTRKNREPLKLEEIEIV